MLHPFAGILDAAAPEVTPAETSLPADGAASRRSFLGRAFAAAAGLMGAGLLAGRSAAAQAQSPAAPRGTAESLPLDGSAAHSVQPVQYTLVQPRSQGSSITQWPRYQHGDPRPTTYALGEEGSYSPPRYRPPRGRYTTYALGEEGTATTYALGEEGGYRPWRPPYHGGYYRPSPVTTYALGEEGGGWRW